MNRREFVKQSAAGAAAVGLGLHANAEDKSKARKQPNIIYMIVHDLGKHCSPYGVPVDTPNLQRIADEGVTLTNAFCASPPCSPSRASAMSGKYPHNNGVVGLSHVGFRASDQFVHLTHYLKEAGYETALAGLQHELAHHDAKRLLKYDKDLKHRGGPIDVFVDTAIDDAIGYLETKKGSDQPFFLNIGTQETHMSMWGPDSVYNKKYNRMELYGGADSEDGVYIPPQMPDNQLSRKFMSHFEPCIRFMDHHVGRLLDAVDRLGLRDDTLIVFTTDHGITSTRGKGTLYDHGMEISFLMRLPGVLDTGSQADFLMNNIDVLPTLVDVAGGKIPDGISGRSFWPAVCGNSYQENGYVFTERNYHNNYDPMRSVRTKDFHYILNLDEEARYFYTPEEILNHPNEGQRQGWPNSKIWMVNSDHQRMENWPMRPKEELFDLRKDPNEFVNVADDPAYASVKAELAMKCDQWMRDTDDPLLKSDIPPTQEQIEMLKRNG